MLKSMTAFGRASGELSGRPLTIEIKSVNHRYLDISVRLPRRYALFEEPIKKKVAAQFSRGKIELLLQVNGNLSRVQGLELDTELASTYYKLLGRMKEEFNLTGEIDLPLMASFKDLLLVKEEEIDAEKDWRVIEGVLHQAMDSIEQMRTIEGKALARDLLKRLDLLSSLSNDIQNHIPEVIREYGDRLRTRIKTLLQDIKVDEGRLAQEIAIMADRSDLTEELVRMESHIDQFRELINMDGPAGRRLDFLIQEMHREANTIGSKSGDAFISHKVVDMKYELEKMREQVQNIE